MISNAKNKDITSESDKVEIKQETLTEYHFAGSGRYYPVSIRAANEAEALKIWEQKRVPYQK